MKNNKPKNMKRALNRTYWISLAIGILIILTNIILQFTDFEHRLIDELFSLGFILIIMSAYALIKRKRNPSYAKQEELEAAGSDERIKQIGEKARSASWFITCGALMILLVTSWITDDQLYYALSSILLTMYPLYAVIVFIFIVHLASYFIAKAYYNKKM